MLKPHRQEPLWFAWIVHRISGVVLALFLPLHFLVLGLAIKGSASLDAFLHWTDYPLVKLAEFGLIFLLALHLFGGLRILALEFLPWTSRQKTLVATSAALSFLLACVFFLNAI